MMRRVYTNETEIPQIVHDWLGRPMKVLPGETAGYDDSGPPGDLSRLIVNTEEIDGTEYVGYAKPGTKEDEPGWAIIKVTTTDDGISKLAANGKFKFSFKWTLKETYNYS